MHSDRPVGARSTRKRPLPARAPMVKLRETTHRDILGSDPHSLLFELMRMFLEPRRPLARLRLGWAAMLVCAAGAVPAGATTWHVSAARAPKPPATTVFRIQDALALAQAGDTIRVGPGHYAESLRTVRPGQPGRPIQLVADGARGSVVVSAPGRVLHVLHADLRVEGFVFDGQYGAGDTVTVASAAHRFTLSHSEVRRSSRDLIDIEAPADVRIEHCLLHHALNAANGRTDAHAVAAGAVRGLVIADTDIHTFSGDGLQVDPGRAAPGWDGVVLERTRIWLAPLPRAENGFPAGAVPGENAVDTKASASLRRSSLVIRDVVASGFRGGLIANMAAFNLKEHVRVEVTRVTVFDSEIAFRLRGPGPAGRGGASVDIGNTLVHHVGTGFRYEEGIQGLTIRHVTVGRSVARPFRRVQSPGSGLDVRNTLVLGQRPPEMAHPSNLAVGPDAFVDAVADDYRLSPGSPAIDAGTAEAQEDTDRAGVPRLSGKAPDVGAFERQPRQEERRMAP